MNWFHLAFLNDGGKLFMKLILATNIADKQVLATIKQPVGASMQKWCNCAWVPKAITNKDRKTNNGGNNKITVTDG